MSGFEIGSSAQGRAPSSGQVRRASATVFAKALIDSTNRFDRENPELRDQWAEHRTAVNALISWLDKVAEEAARG